MNIKVLLTQAKSLRKQGQRVVLTGPGVASHKDEIMQAQKDVTPFKDYDPAKAEELFNRLTTGLGTIATMDEDGDITIYEDVVPAK